MLTNITLENFKCFKEETQFPLKQINLLTGINGRGKSTLLQSLLLMRQSIDYHNLTSQIILNGSCIKLGKFEDIRNTNISRDEKILLRYQFNYLSQPDDVEFESKYILGENKEDNRIVNIDSCSFSSSIFKNTYNLKPPQSKNDRKLSNTLLNLIPALTIREKEDEIVFEEMVQTNFYYFFQTIHYISADRIGPHDFYLKDHLSEFPNVGARGENTINLLDKLRDCPVNEELCLGDDAQTLLTQTQEWLKEIFEGATLDIPKSKSTVIEPLFNTDSSKNRYKGSNIGFGYSYILPIIVSGLIAKPGEVLIVENPEAHLHPRAQSRLVRFLAKVSQTGVQVFIETHSDHILNALRIAVYDMLITNEEANILYFPPEIGQPIIQIPIQENGRIENWPPGFFDQMDEDFKVLFGV